jgi:hypothetical protein
MHNNSTSLALLLDGCSCLMKSSDYHLFSDKLEFRKNVVFHVGGHGRDYAVPQSS